MRRILLILLLAMLGTFSSVPPAGLNAQSTVPVQTGNVTLSSVADWQGGTRAGLLVSNNAGGELRLDENHKQGTFDSGVYQTPFPFHAIGAIWKADVPPGTQLTLEVRAGSAADQLGEYQSFTATDARSQNDNSFALESVLPFTPTLRFFQLRALFNATAANASPVLNEITLSYFNATAGPALSAGLARVPVPYGPSTLTTPPRIIQRSDWNNFKPTAQIARQTPQAIVLHQIGNDSVGADPLPFLRALVAYDTQVLGWDDVPFHFVVDSNGNIFEGHVGGPDSVVPRLAGGDNAIHVALIGNAALSASAQTTLVGLFAWLSEAYHIAPVGQHTFTPPQGTPITLQNIVAHNEVVAEATDPSSSVRGLMDQLRQSVDQSVVRSRWYFAEGNPEDYSERLAVLNSSANPASVRFRLLRQPGPEIVRTANVAPGARFDLIINNIISDTNDVPVIVEANTQVIVERYMDFQTDISVGPGVTTPARVWYFAEGSTAANAKTFLLLFNPQSQDVNATVTYMKEDGTTAEQEVSIAPLQRTVIAVGDKLPNVGFGTRVIANQPIIAERTMIFGPNSTLTTGGFHTTPGILTLSRNWYFAEGTTQSPFQMSVLVLNPNAQPTNVAVTFQTPDGTSLTRQYAIPPTTRLPIRVNEVVPDLGVATTVTADRPVAVERAMYWKDNSVGTVDVGAISPSYTWRFADGRTSDNFQEYLLFNNPNKNQARVSVEFVQVDGTKATQSIVMPGGSRYTMAVHQLYPGQTAIAATVHSTQPIVAERSLYPGAPDTAANRGGATAFGVPESDR